MTDQVSYAKSSEEGQSTASGILDFCRAAYGEYLPVMVFQVHCDESGKLQDRTCVCFAACVFRGEAVADFGHRWREYLSDARIRYLHMKEAMGLDGEFSGWTNRIPDRDSLLEVLGRLLFERSDYHTVFPMDTAKFQALGQRERDRLKDPLYAAFEGLMRDIRQDAAHFGNRDFRFHLVYDLAEEYSKGVLKLFNKLRMREVAYRQFFPSLTFADDIEFAPLQAADILAYCYREEFERGKDECRPVIQKLLQIFRSSHSVHATMEA